MEMEDDLACIWAVVGDDPVAGFSDSSLRCHLLDGTEQMADQGCISSRDLMNGRNVLLRNDQQMNWRHWVDVLEGQHMVVLKDLGGRDLPPDDLAKETVGRQTNHSKGCNSGLCGRSGRDTYLFYQVPDKLFYGAEKNSFRIDSTLSKV